MTTQKNLMIDVCQQDQNFALLRAANSIKDLSPMMIYAVKNEYVRREANGEAPLYEGHNRKLQTPSHHAYIHLCNCIRGCWLK